MRVCSAGLLLLRRCRCRGAVLVRRAIDDGLQADRIGDADLATAEEAYQVGNMSRAHIFARRARDKLTLATPNGQRADDIMALSDPRNRPRGSRPGFANTALHTQH